MGEASGDNQQRNGLPMALAYSPMHLFDLSNEDYHGDLSRVSKSGLDLLHRCPKRFKWELIDGNRREPTEAMTIGTQAHVFTLEPGKISDHYMRAPQDAPKRPTERQLNAKKPSDETVKAIEYWRDFDTISKEKEVLTAERWEQLEGMSRAVWDNRFARQLLEEDGWAESTLLWTHPESGIDCKTRPDWLLKDGSIMVDLKTTKDAGPAFERSAMAFRYHVQAAFYMKAAEVALGQRPDKFIFLCVEKEPPFLCSVYVADEELIRAGEEEMETDLQVLQACRNTQQWPDYGDTVRPLRLPPWMRKQREAQAPTPSQPINTDLVF